MIKAFTLAEVLITLGIIGVVSAMTMPVLVNNVGEKEILSRLNNWRASDLGVNSDYDIFFFYVDVNGDKKPNTLGRDVFQFVVTKEKGTLIPAGSGNDSAKCSVDDKSKEAGIDCAAKVLSEGKISY